MENLNKTTVQVNNIDVNSFLDLVDEVMGFNVASKIAVREGDFYAKCSMYFSTEEEEQTFIKLADSFMA